MNDILRPFLNKFCIIYFDDILIFNASLSDHLEHLRLILSSLCAHKLYLNLDKCSFASHNINFLGYVISGEGIHTDPSKISDIKSWPTPSSIIEVHSFVGLANYYKRYLRF